MFGSNQQQFPARSFKRSRIVIAWLFLAVGLIVIVADVPPSWQDFVMEQVNTVSSLVSSFGLRPLSLLVGLLLSAFAASLLFVWSQPGYVQGWFRDYAAAERSSIAPISNYVDIENQLSAATVKPFIAYVKQELKGQRADRFYFADASLYARDTRSVELRRAGFLPIDVPHEHVGVSTVKNVVDVELALHAYERSLRGPDHQRVILIAADQDYLPLVYRLRAQGHEVDVWARALPPSYKSLVELIGIRILEFDTLFPDEATKEQTVASDPAALARLEAAIVATLELVRTVSVDSRSPKERLTELGGRLGTMQQNLLLKIGYIGNNRVRFWLQHMSALGVLVWESPQEVPFPGNTQPAQATHELDQLLHTVAGAANAIASRDRNGIVRLTELCAHITERPPVLDSAGLSSLTDLLRSMNPQHMRHMAYLCQSAKALGIMEFEKIATKSGSIKVAPPKKQDDTSPSDD